LYGKLTKKNQPDYKHAMKALPAQEMYHEFLEFLRSNYKPEKVHDGIFGAMMDVELVNDGPVTIIIESEVSLKTSSSSSAAPSSQEDATMDTNASKSKMDVRPQSSVD
jgi:D-tyrosyl-tRNA(Tyr) deacylase